MPQPGFFIANTYQYRIHDFAETILGTFFQDNSKLTSNPPHSMILLLKCKTSFRDYMSINPKPDSPVRSKIYNLDSPEMRTVESLIWDRLADPLIEKYNQLNKFN